MQNVRNLRYTYRIKLRNSSQWKTTWPKITLICKQKRKRDYCRFFFSSFLNFDLKTNRKRVWKTIAESLSVLITHIINVNVHERDVAYYCCNLSSSRVTCDYGITLWQYSAVKNKHNSRVSWHCGRDKHLANAKFPLCQKFTELTYTWTWLTTLILQGTVGRAGYKIV